MTKAPECPDCGNALKAGHASMGDSIGWTPDDDDPLRPVIPPQPFSYNCSGCDATWYPNAEGTLKAVPE